MLKSIGLQLGFRTDPKKLRESNNIVLENLRVAPIDKRCTNVLERLQR